jgi:Uncharacterized protein conserved in bacteria (DUF2188)
MDSFTWEIKPGGDKWKVYREGVRVLQRTDRQEAIDYARKEASLELDVFEHDVRLLITNADGSVDEEQLSSRKAAT